MLERTRAGMLRWLRFTATLVWETLGRTRLGVLLGTLVSSTDPLDVEGVEAVPEHTPFVLAVNHYGQRHTMEVVAAVVGALRTRRPRLAEELAVVVGADARPRTGFRGVIQRIAQRVAGWITARWERNLIRLRPGSGVASIVGVRQWMARAERVPTFVFPEGRVNRVLGSVRTGCGEVLSSVKSVTVPLGVWFDAGSWHVRIGSAITWSARRELRDAQLGLMIAALLPRELIPDWSEMLDRWRAVHTEEA